MNSGTCTRSRHFAEFTPLQGGLTCYVSPGFPRTSNLKPRTPNRHGSAVNCQQTTDNSYYTPQEFPKSHPWKPPSTTICSTSRQVWPLTLSKQSRIVPAALKLVVIIEIFNREPNTLESKTSNRHPEHALHPKPSFPRTTFDPDSGEIKLAMQSLANRHEKTVEQRNRFCQ